MKSSVIVFPGSNCDRDVAVALEKFKIKNQMVWHDETNLPKSDIVILPGGFSYGDYLRTGCIASKSKIISDVIKHAKNGGLVLGICNGFQILIETGLLSGVLLRNKKLRFLSKNIFLKVINDNNKFCLNYRKKNIIELPIAHNEGNYFADNEQIK
jgi:phosphoribosylformylglycinamidine synthase